MAVREDLSERGDTRVAIMTARGLCKAKAQATVEEDGLRLVDKVTAWPS